jgi:hypothetical protein
MTQESFHRWDVRLAWFGFAVDVAMLVLMAVSEFASR